jgi:hypothetical protein
MPYICMCLSPHLSRLIINQVRVTMPYICMCLSPHLLEKGGKRHIQMYGMVTPTWFIIGLDKCGERHIQMYGMVTLHTFVCVSLHLFQDQYKN